MRIVSIVSQKGGAGKTTVAVNLAVAALAAGEAGTIIDIDPQATASNWGDRRQTAFPTIISAQAARLPHVLKQASSSAWVFIDTPPAISNTTMAAVKVADIVLVPSRAAIFDLDTLSATLDLVRMGQREAVVVLNAVPSRGPDTEEAREVISNYGATVAPIALGHRAAFQHAGINGLGVVEYEPGGKAAYEIRELFDWLRDL